jgi:hypothetical protein
MLCRICGRQRPIFIFAVVSQGDRCFNPPAIRKRRPLVGLFRSGVQSSSLSQFACEACAAITGHNIAIDVRALPRIVLWRP